MAAQFTATNGPAARRLVSCKRSGYELLARSRVTDDEHGRVGSSHLLHRPVQELHARRLADQLSESIPFASNLAETTILGLEGPRS